MRSQTFATPILNCHRARDDSIPSASSSIIDCDCWEQISCLLCTVVVVKRTSKGILPWAGISVSLCRFDVFALVWSSSSSVLLITAL